MAPNILLHQRSSIFTPLPSQGCLQCTLPVKGGGIFHLPPSLMRPCMPWCFSQWSANDSHPLVVIVREPDALELLPMCGCPRPPIGSGFQRIVKAGGVKVKPLLPMPSRLLWLERSWSFCQDNMSRSGTKFRIGTFGGLSPSLVNMGKAKFQILKTFGCHFNGINSKYCYYIIYATHVAGVYSFTQVCVDIWRY